MSARSEVPTKDNIDVMSTRAWESALNADERDDTNQDYGEVEEQQVKPGPAPEEENDFIVTSLQEMIANGVKQQVENRFVAIAEMVEKSSSSVLKFSVQWMESALRYTLP